MSSINLLGQLSRCCNGDPTEEELRPVLLRLLELSYNLKLAHLSSNITALPIIYKIYKHKQPDDLFVLSAGHMALAQYVVLEKFLGLDAASLYAKHGTHPNRDLENGLHCSTGSLGLGLSIATGLAIGNPNQKVDCLISDGECAEGIIWEALRFIEDNNITKVQVHLNANGYCATKSVDLGTLIHRVMAFNPCTRIYCTPRDLFSCLNGVEAHYHVLTQAEYELILTEIK